MKRLALFGGSFNPIHLAHLVLAEWARDALELDQVLFIPAGEPPHKREQKLVAGHHRLRMVRLAIADHRAFGVSDIELNRDGPSYSIDTVTDMRRKVGNTAEIYFLIGSDSLADLPGWHRVRELVRLCTIVTLTRPRVRMPKVSDLAPRIGKKAAERLLAHTIRMPRLEISASDLRKRVVQGKSIRYLVPDAVREYIRKHGLYRD